MADLSKISEINKVIEEYFTNNPSEKIVPAKKLMPEFISAGIFGKDHRKGLPIRTILRDLDKADQLDQIPFVYAERNDIDVYWYFIQSKEDAPTTPYKQDIKEEKETPAFALSDESYVIDMCDVILNRKAYRQKRFDFLKGDLHKDGKSRTKLPVGGFYEDLNLVVEYVSNTVCPADATEWEAKKFAARDKQRKAYDERRAEELPKNNVNLVIIPHFKFVSDKQNKIVRNESKDKSVVKKLLRDYIK